jgi:chloramphenicol-sensitive protein RarD
MSHHEQQAGVIAGLTAYLVWGLLTVYWKQLTGFDAFELIAWRITTASIIMAAVLTVGRRWSHLAVLRNRSVLARVALAAVLLTANWTAYVWAVVHGRVLETALGYFIAPLFTVTLGVVVLKETLYRAQWVALGLAAAAVVVLTVSYGRLPWISLILACTWSLYGYLKKHASLTPVESMAAESFLLTPAALVVLVALGSQSDSIPATASTGEMALVLLSGLATVTPLTLFAYAAHRVPLTILGPMQYIIPSINFVLGWLIYDEALPAERVVGFGLVWIGLLVLTIDTVRRRTGVRAPVPVAG